MAWLKKAWEWLVSFVKKNPQTLRLIVKMSVEETLAHTKITVAELNSVLSKIDLVRPILLNGDKVDFSSARVWLATNLTGTRKDLVLELVNVVEAYLPTWTAKLNVTDVTYVNAALNYVEEAVSDFITTH